MPMVTLIGEKLAKKGTEFIYIGPNNECRNCKLKTVCFNLKIGRKYEITQIREKRHNCNVHEGTAAVVEVKELPIITAVDQSIKEGESIKVEENNCSNIGCEFYQFCSVFLPKDKSFKIVKIMGKIKCPEGKKLQKVEIAEE